MTLKGLKVLLVEDDILILHDLKASLAREGAEIITATSVVTGLTACEEVVDAAILDIRLGDDDVLPIAEKLHAQAIPLIFHSALSERQDVVDAFPDAMSLGKPVRASVLIEAVAEATKES